MTCLQQEQENDTPKHLGTFPYIQPVQQSQQSTDLKSGLSFLHFIVKDDHRRAFTDYPRTLWKRCLQMPELHTFRFSLCNSQFDPESTSFIKRKMT